MAKTFRFENLIQNSVKHLACPVRLAGHTLFKRHSPAIEGNTHFASRLSVAGFLFFTALTLEKTMSNNFASAARHYYDIHSGAAYIGVSEITLRRMIAANQIEHLRVAPSKKRILFTQEQLDGYLSRCAQPLAA